MRLGEVTWFNIKSTKDDYESEATEAATKKTDEAGATENTVKQKAANQNKASGKNSVFLLFKIRFFLGKSNVFHQNRVYTFQDMWIVKCFMIIKVIFYLTIILTIKRVRATLRVRIGVGVREFNMF